MPTFFSIVKVMGKEFHGKASSSKKQAQHVVAEIAYNALKDCPHDDERDARKKRKTGSPPPERELPEYPFDKRFTPKLDNSSLTEWKWEGTITKFGTPICRAHCFPVGKVPDMSLPEFVDCTARTSLDMLLNYYNQAVGVWVAFFLPGSDAHDTKLFTQFMHSLEEKQQAAVSMLDNTTTLFLVPPSNFSEKVLKVPGNKLTISAVILRLYHSGIPLYGNQDNSYNLEMRHFDPLLSMPVGSLPLEQLAQLAASFFEQKRHSGRSSLNASELGDPRQKNRFNQSGNNRVNYEPSMSQFGQVQQLQKQQQISNVPQMLEMMVQREPQRGASGNQQLTGCSSHSQEDAEGDPEKRLRATLLLAADLLKQIRQGKGT